MCSSLIFRLSYSFLSDILYECHACINLAIFAFIFQISYASSSPFLTNRLQFKTYFQMLASEINLAYGYYGLIQQFQWKKVAIIVEQQHIFTVVRQQKRKIILGWLCDDTFILIALFMFLYSTSLCPVF